MKRLRATDDDLVEVIGLAKAGLAREAARIARHRRAV